MKQGNPVVGYALLVVAVLLLGLVIATVARDIRGTGGAVQIAEPGVTPDQQAQQPAARQPQAKPQQGRVWEGIM